MKKIYFLLSLLVASSSFGQVIYQANSETGFRYNPNNDSLVIYDDCIMTLPGSSTYSIKVTKLDVGIRRLAGAPAVDVAIYIGRASGDTVPQTIDSLTMVSLPATATASTDVVSYNNAAGFSFNVNKLNADATKAAVYTGVRFLGPNFNNGNIGWRLVSSPTVGTAGPNFYNVNRYTNALIGPLALSSGGTPVLCYFYTTITGSFQAALPVNISLFKASYINNDVVLNWKTESESNSAYFDVEISRDGLHFTSLAKVNAAGSSTTQKNYSYTQTKPDAGNYYYRLKMVDKDNSFEYSATQKINIGGKAIRFKILPNPVQHEFKFNWSAAGNYRYQIIGISGKQFQLGPVLQGLNQVNVSGLSAGVYIIDVLDATGKVISSEKMIKQ